MLAPPQRRAADRKRKRRQLVREKQDLHRVELWLTGHALAGLIRQLIITQALTDKAANNHRSVENAIGKQLEQQGLTWR
jgi:hypothetical protein